MQIEFSAEQDTRLADLASHRGVEASELVKDAALRMLLDEASFKEFVEQGIAEADRGQLLDPPEVWARVEAQFS